MFSLHFVVFKSLRFLGVVSDRNFGREIKRFSRNF